ncbi:MAG: hypothetical protein AAGA66_09965 [Bacteroidota bacterium]
MKKLSFLTTTFLLLFSIACKEEEPVIFIEDRTDAELMAALKSDAKFQSIANASIDLLKKIDFTEATLDEPITDREELNNIAEQAAVADYMTFLKEGNLSGYFTENYPELNGKTEIQVREILSQSIVINPTANGRVSNNCDYNLMLGLAMVGVIASMSEIECARRHSSNSGYLTCLGLASVVVAAEVHDLFVVHRFCTDLS